MGEPLFFQVRKEICFSRQQKPERERESIFEHLIKSQMAGFRLVFADFLISCMWIWSGAMIKIFVSKILGLGSHQPSGEFITGALYVLSMFLFAWLGKITRGGAYNPLTVFSRAISGSFSTFLVTVGARIPAQVFGSIVGVRTITQIFPKVGYGPRLNVDVHRGALTEGLLTFAIVIIAQGLSKKDPGSFFMKTWITSISKLTLHILGSDLTGGVMNPASVFGWAYARGDYITKEHLLVYWLAPIEATLLAVWIFKLLFNPHSHKKQEEKETKGVKTE